MFGVAIFASAAMLMWSAALDDSDPGCLDGRHWTKPAAIVAVVLVLLICVVMTISSFGIAATAGH